MYKIIGIDQKEYGPVSGTEIRQWIRENRANAQTRARAEGALDWRPLNLYPEFADQFAAPPPPPPQYSQVPQYYYPRPQGNGMATTGLVFSLFGLFCCCFPIFPLLGLLFAIIGLMKNLKNPLRGGKAVAIVAIVLAVLELLFWLAMFGLSLAGNGPNITFNNHPI